MNRNLGLDLIRAVAISLVLFAHSIQSVIFGISIGVLGVEIFFVLSGYLIGQILIRDFSNNASISTLANFWLRRWFRTLPLYYAIILFKFIFIDHSLGYKIFAFVFFLQNNFVGIDFMPVTWSLVIEEWFYLLIPILIAVVFRNGIFISPKRFIYFLIGLILIITTARLLWVIQTNRPWAAIVGNFPFRLDSLLIGVVLAAIKMFYKNVHQKLESVLVFVIGLIIFILTILLGGYLSVEMKMDAFVLSRVLWISFLSMSIALLFPYLEKQFKITSPLFLPFSNAIKFISLISYSLYLVHSFTFIKPFGNIYLDVFVSYTLTLIVSAITYRFLELPIMKLRDKMKFNN